jgi:uncharacterized membrane protein
MENKESHKFVFDKSNYRFLFIGLALNIIGFILMVGGAAESKDVFNAETLFSHTRITVAPILIVTGYIVIIYGIIKKNKSSQEEKLD